MSSRTLRKVIPNQEVLQTLEGLQTLQPSNGDDAANDIVFLHGQPNCGNTSRIPLAIGIIRGDVPVVSIQPTDAAAAYAYNAIRDVVGPTAPVGYTPQSEAFEIKLALRQNVWYVSARQFLLHSEEILQHVSVVILDEIHYSSVDHELSAILLRERLRQKDPPVCPSTILMSSYIQPSDMHEPLFETITTVELGRPDNSTKPSPMFRYDNENREDVDGYFETVISALKEIAPTDGPVLVFVPDVADVSTLTSRLRDEKLLKKRKGPSNGEAWDFAPFISMNAVESTSPFKMRVDQSIIISLPYHHTHRQFKGLSFKNVICPHWVRGNWYTKDYGKEIPQSLALSKSGMEFLVAHGQQVWLACTKQHYEAPENWRKTTVPFVRLVDPAEYYLKAHYLFKDRSPYAGAVNPLPLRYPVGDDRVAWFIHRAVMCDLVDCAEKYVSERTVLNRRGNDVVAFMLEAGLDFRWALCLANIRTLIGPQSPEDEERAQKLFDLTIPLAIVMSKQESVLRPQGKEFGEKRYISDAAQYINNDSRARIFGDAWCDAECLSLHLSGKLDRLLGRLHWVAGIPENLEAMVERIRCLPQVTGDQDDNKVPLRTHEMLFVEHKPSDMLYGRFNTLMYGSATSNLACVKQAYEGIDDDGNALQGIGIATDISSGKEVILSRESLLDLTASLNEIEKGLIYVTYNRIHRIKPTGCEAGPSLMISGLSALNTVLLSDTFHRLTRLPSGHTGSIRPWVAYPFGD